MKTKPYSVTMTYDKNIARRHAPPRFEERSKNETFWSTSAEGAMRQCKNRYGAQVTVKSAAMLPGWEKVIF
jgi:hypothetical protein